MKPPRFVVVLGTFALSGAALWACGPFIPDWILGDDESVLVAPTVRFRAEVESLLPPNPDLRAVTGESGPARQTADADEADLRAALAANGMAADRQRDLLERHRQLREILVAHADSSPDFKAPLPEGSPVAAVQVPEGLPPEFEAYLRGAVAYHQGKLDEARRHWEGLLALPEGERRFRSTWAAFMLGKTAMRTEAAAAQWFERTREIASRKDFKDSLGLAAASLGWQALAELSGGRIAPAINLYAEQVRTGEPSAQASIKLACARALSSPPETLAEVARDDRARRLVTALVLARTRSFYVDSEGSEGIQAEARKWLAAIEKAGAKIPSEEADRLAWTAYRAADFDAAGRWLQRQEPASPMGKWIRAKLLLRDGKLAEAEALLQEAAASLASTPLDEDEAFDLMFEGSDPVNTSLRASGEAGAAALPRQDYTRALQELLEGAYWRDAAYVAERVLTVDELKAYVDERWPASLARKPDPEIWNPNLPGLLRQPAEEISYNIRYLLARRLIRSGRPGEAAAYLPADLQADLRELAAGAQAGRDTQLTREQQASGLFRAACVTRWKGLELLGTEIEPDWFLFAGQYDLGSAFEDRKTSRRFGPAADEIERARRHEARPAKRFHYRYTAAEQGWQAAALLPDGSPDKARILASSGSWIKDREPQAAERFFRELVRCCGTTELGREAKARRWFPEVDGCRPAEE